MEDAGERESRWQEIERLVREEGLRTEAWAMGLKWYKERASEIGEMGAAS